MTAAHTPGPWEFGYANNYDGYWIAPFGTLPTLGAVRNVQRHDGTWAHVSTINCFNFPGSTEANARLIAAAPELLDHCIKALAAWEGTGPSILLDDLRAVISKATGALQ